MSDFNLSDTIELAKDTGFVLWDSLGNSKNGTVAVEPKVYNRSDVDIELIDTAKLSEEEKGVICIEIELDMQSSNENEEIIPVVIKHTDTRGIKKDK